jgi:nickel-type superoxide dismutase maturation protease
MEPALRHGDRLVIWRTGRVREGDIVALADPRDRGRTLLKRVAALHPAGVFVLGDNAQRSTDSRHFGPVGTRSLIGKAVYRYAPLARAGRLRAPGEP